MARSGHTIEKLLDLVAQDGAKGSGVQFLFGSAAPGGDTDEQDAAPIGSLYLRVNGASSAIYQKIASANAPADWQENSATGATIGNWRTERVDAVTGDTLVAGNTDPTTWTDNDDGTAAAAFTIGNYVLDGNCDLWEITGISAPNITLAAAASAPVADDMFAVKYYMPDPAGQENQAIVTFTGSACVKVSDVDWEFANAINLTGGYAASAGNPTSADSVESAIAKLDGNNDAQDTLLGTAQGATDLGTFTGDIISDNTSVSGALQELETELVDTRGNVDDLITLSGMPENSTSFGAFSGDILPDSSDAKTIYQAIENELDQLTTKEVTGITALATVDEVNVDAVCSCKWLICAFEEATPANKQSMEVYAMHDGTASADATATDETVYAKLKVGSNFDLDITVDVNGTGAAQTMRLRATSSTAGVTVTARRISVQEP